MKKNELMTQIKAKAEELGLNQSDVAERCGLTKGVVSKHWRGIHPPSLENICRYAKGLNLKIELR